jgi:hypothetical protein
MAEQHQVLLTVEMRGLRARDVGPMLEQMFQHLFETFNDDGRLVKLSYDIGALKQMKLEHELLQHLGSVGEDDIYTDAPEYEDRVAQFQELIGLAGGTFTREQLDNVLAMATQEVDEEND